MNSKLSYRSDIDGLRAVAVLSVVFYHAGMKLFSGGYVGVDVFFVISGFLITTIIVREIEAGEFSIIKFYERRIRRIYPALYTTLLFILIAAYFLYNPEVFAQACKSILATIGFVSNILFWTQSGYFAAPATLTPLLHTWSLAVEEQFYIFFPLLVLLIMRYARKWLKVSLGILALLSFFLSLYYIKQDASAAFYFPHLRAWELLIGGLLSINVVPVKIHSTLRHTLSIIGLGMIIVSILSYSENTSFPGASALLPTLGSALIIYSGMGGESLVGKILSWSPFVFIGKISYSFYLWHWPVIIFGRYFLIQNPTSLQMFLLVAASFLFSAFSWLVVERPFRSRSFLPAPKIFVFAGSVMAVALLISGVSYLEQGLPGRFSKEELATFSDTNSGMGRPEEMRSSGHEGIQRYKPLHAGRRHIRAKFYPMG
ncbi:MAG: acyltransferase [Anaerolineales bacterium]